jgi:hypothetical protein
MEAKTLAKGVPSGGPAYPKMSTALATTFTRFPKITETITIPGLCMPKK